MLIDEIRSKTSFNETTNSSNFLSDRSCESLLTILDDKNRAIASLQQQLLNQKEQLNFYLSKGLESPKIYQLSKTCLPQAIDENIPVTLAICKFYKNIGMKSRIMCLHERMCQIDNRIESILQTQQCVLREIISRMCEVPHTSESGFDPAKYLFNLSADKCQWDIFTALLKSTMSLIKELDTFRICCDRLILIEDERNEIVEQVYSLPIEQRLNCNYIIGIQMEKMKLESEMKNIMREQSALRKRIYELGMLDFNLGKFQQEFQLSVGELCSDYQISRLLDELNADASALLNMSKEHKTKCAEEIKGLKDENKYLQEILSDLYNSGSSQKSGGNITLQMEDAYFSHLKQIYDKLVEQFETEKQDFIREELQITDQLLKENEKLNRELLQSEREKHTLTVSLYELQKKYKEIHSDHENEIKQIKSERDSYKLQVEDLLAIRSAYAQLIEKQTNIAETEQSYQLQLKDKDKTISELELERNRLKNRHTYYEEVFLMQKSQLKYLIGIIEKLCQEAEEPQEIEYSSNKACVPYNSQKSTKTPSRNTTGYNSESERTQDESFNFENYPSEINISQSSSLSDDFKLKNYSRQGKASKIPTKTKFYDRVKNVVIQTEERRGTDSSPPRDNSTSETRRQEKKGSAIENKRSFSTTSLHIQSRQKDGRTEIIKAFIESTSNVEGTFKVGDTSVFFKFDCKPIELEIAKKEKEIDEYELMKDCSMETIPAVCPQSKEITLEGLKGNQKRTENLVNDVDNTRMNGELHGNRGSNEPNKSIVNKASRLKRTDVADVTRQLDVIASQVSVNPPLVSEKSLILAEVKTIYEQFLE